MNRCMHCDARADACYVICHEGWCPLSPAAEPASLGLGRDDICDGCGRAGTTFILHAYDCPRLTQPRAKGYEPPSGAVIAEYLRRQVLPLMIDADPRILGC